MLSIVHPRTPRLLRVLPLLVALALSGWLLPGASAAPAAARDGFWSAGPGASSGNSLMGFIDTPAEGSTIPAGMTFDVSGWLVDFASATNPGITAVQLYQGQMGNGGTLLASGMVGSARPDVGTAFKNANWNKAGWTITVPAGTFTTPGSQTLTVYANTPTKGWWQKTLTVAIGAPPTPVVAPAATPLRYLEEPIGEILSPRDGAVYSSSDVNSHVTLTGWAIDRNAAASQGAGIAQVRLNVDGHGLSNASLGQSHGNGQYYGAQFAHAGWQGDLNASDVGNGRHTLTVTILSAVTGRERQLSVQFTLHLGCDLTDSDDDDDDHSGKDQLPAGC